MFVNNIGMVSLQKWEFFLAQIDRFFEKDKLLQSLNGWTGHSPKLSVLRGTKYKSSNSQMNWSLIVEIFFSE